MKFFVKSLAVLACAITMTASPLTVAQESVPPDNATRAAIEQVLRDVIAENPEIIYDALVRYRDQQDEEARKVQTSAVTESYDQIVAGQPAIGSEHPAVTLVEFFDYNCGYCKRSLDTVLNIINSENDVRVIFLEYPILAPSSTTAAKAALAAERQGRYLDLHTALMEHRGALTDEIVLEIAASEGLNVDTLMADMESSEIVRQVDRNRALGQALGINGTPTFLVEREIIPGAIEEADLRQLIEAARSG